MRRRGIGLLPKEEGAVCLVSFLTLTTLTKRCLTVFSPSREFFIENLAYR
jgi:hypothetical protein